MHCCKCCLAQVKTGMGPNRTIPTSDSCRLGKGKYSKAPVAHPGNPSLARNITCILLFLQKITEHAN